MLVRDYRLMCRDRHEIVLDVFKPEDNLANRTSLLFVHGGGFVGGDKDQFLGAASYLAWQYGAVCVSVQYRTAKDSPYPGAVTDVVETIDWMVQHAVVLGIDPRRMFLIGGSPGANILLLAMSGAWRKRHAIPSGFLPTHAIALNGIFDLESFWERNPEEHGSLTRYFRLEEVDRHLVFPEASPSQNPYHDCSFTFLHGTADTVVPYEECLRMADTLRAQGNQVAVIPFEGKRHAWFNTDVNQYAVWNAIGSVIIQK